MRPIDVGVDPQHIGRIEKAKDVRSARSRALESEAAVNLILKIQRLVKARLQSILMRVADDRNLIVVPCAAGKIGQGIELQQSLRLRADGHNIAGKRQSSCRIEDLNGLPGRIQDLGEISIPFRQRSGP